LITVPLEVAMNGLPGLTVTRSISLYGLSNVRVTFQDGTDPYSRGNRCSSGLATPVSLTA
jgi:Cu/Ag efflux pump CusA